MTPVPLGASVPPLERLNAALPANPEHDNPVEAAARAVVAEHEALLLRLRAAEDVCALYGWTGLDDQSDRSKALHELWAVWVDFAGEDAAKRSSHRHLSDEFIAALAQHRDRTREATLAAIKAGTRT